MPPLRFACRAFALAVGTQVTFSAACLGIGYLCEDKSFDEHWRFSVPIRTKPAPFYSFRKDAVTKEESACLNDWVAILNQKPLDSWDRFDPDLITLHTLVLYDGRKELQTAFRYHRNMRPWLRVEVSPVEVRREYQDDAIFLHCTMESDFHLTVPFIEKQFSWSGTNSKSTLLLEWKPVVGPDGVQPTSSQKVKTALAITGVEERWFGGPMWSSLSNSVRSPWGDIGDLVRRLNGFTVTTLPQTITDVKDAVISYTA